MNSAPNHRTEVYAWRCISRSDLGLSDVISDSISSSRNITSDTIRSLRTSRSLLMFSDYGGTHKGARYEVYSFLITTPAALSSFDTMRIHLRQGGLGTQRRMAYKALNDNVRLRSLADYLHLADHITGVLISIAVDKKSIHRFSDSYEAETAFGTVGPWSSKSFGRLSRVAHLAAILIEGLRDDGQNLLWITDEDEIVANQIKHGEATRLIGHLLSHYCTANMGHFRFGTTASDVGDLLIEDLTSVPDLAAGSLNDILFLTGLRSETRVPEKLFIGANGMPPIKIQRIASWLSDSSGALKKTNVVVDEGADGCWVRLVSVETQLPPLLNFHYSGHRAFE